MIDDEYRIFLINRREIPIKKIQHSILIIVNGDGEVDGVTFEDVVKEMEVLPGRVMGTWLPCHGRFPEGMTKESGS